MRAMEKSAGAMRLCAISATLTKLVQNVCMKQVRICEQQIDLVAQKPVVPVEHGQAMPLGHWPRVHVVPFVGPDAAR
jgi:hypothetical protein